MGIGVKYDEELHKKQIFKTMCQDYEDGKWLVIHTENAPGGKG